MKFIARFIALIVVSIAPALACTDPLSVCTKAAKTSFPLIVEGQPATLLIEASANPAVKYASENFAADLERVSGKPAPRVSDLSMANGDVVIAGVVGHSAVIDELARAGKISVSDLAGQWEAFRQIVVEKPFKNVPRALIIVGSDRRGAVFGLYDISEAIGVSPWYWFADAPVARKSDVYLVAGSRRDQPKVRYRGFFINDEAPAFSTWAQKHYGGANHEMYAHVFELLLRLKGNYLWPAMWAPRAFNDDDPQNMVLADAMGVVLGTSHHEPMTRAQAEWHRNEDKGVTGGKWDYTKNGANLRKFWRGGIERMWNGGTPYECLVTIGMRGDGDEPMAENTATQLLESIVAAQRDIIRDVTARPAEMQPQVWALYKEVQDYYDHGMKVPDDVTLLFADDNWGQVRRLPTGDFDRKGGYGVYYHFDYVGGPRNYKWLNTNQIEKVWQQMDLSYRRGAQALWVVNVGDIKPMEFPLSFFMAQAWDPEDMTLDAVSSYPEAWAQSVFGAARGKQIGGLLTRYARLAALRKPELVDADTFALGAGTGPELDGGEFGEWMTQWSNLVRDLLKVRAQVPEAQYDAFFQLVEHPIIALSNYYQLWYMVAWNRRLAAAGDPRANTFADRAEAAFKRDDDIMRQYHALKSGKWDGMMLQTHIGYTTWQQPETQVMPAVKRLPVAGKPADIVFAKSSSEAARNADAIILDAASFDAAHGAKGLEWHVIPNLGRTGTGAVTAFPQGRPATGHGDAIYLEYAIDAPGGDASASLHLLPTLDTGGGVDVRIGVSLDDGPMQTLSMRLLPSPSHPTQQEQRNWEQAVINNEFVLEAKFPGVTAGKHVLKVWRIDDNVLLSKLVIRKG